jgi:hypothetical protein
MPLQFPTTKITPHDPTAQVLHGLDCALSDVIDRIQQTSDHEALFTLHKQLTPLIETAIRVQGMCLTRIEGR